MASYQTVWIDDTQDGQFSAAEDGALAAGRFIGASFVAGKDFPVIGRVLENQVLTGGSSAVLWADQIASFYPLIRIWCTIVPPGLGVDTDSGSPVIDVSTRDLSFNPLTGRYEVAFDGFVAPGQYRISFYALAIWDSVSPSKSTSVNQAGFVEKLILVAGGPSTASNYPAVRGTAELVYDTFQARLFDCEQRLRFERQPG
jgi:hypothetical protein